MKIPIYIYHVSYIPIHSACISFNKAMLMTKWGFTSKIILKITGKKKNLLKIQQKKKSPKQIIPNIHDKVLTFWDIH